MRTAGTLKSIGQIVVILGVIGGVLAVVAANEPIGNFAGLGVLLGSLLNGLLLLGFGVAVEQLVQIKNAVKR